MAGTDPYPFPIGVFLIGCSFWGWAQVTRWPPIQKHTSQAGCPWTPVWTSRPSSGSTTRSFVHVSPKRRIAAIEMLGTLVFTAFLVEKNDRDKRLPIVPLHSDNQGNVYSLLPFDGRPDGAYALTTPQRLHPGTVSREAVKRDFNQWADLHVSRLERISPSFVSAGIRFQVASHLQPEWCAVRPRVPPLARYDTGLFSRQAHQCRTISYLDLLEGPEALGAFSPDSLGGPSRIATFTLPLAVKRGKCRWLLSGSVVLVFCWHVNEIGMRGFRACST